MLKHHTIEGYECRTEAMYKIADTLGINYKRGNKSLKLDKIYRDLAPVFKGNDTLPIGTGKSGRLRQAPFIKLYNFAKAQYNIEVTEWNIKNIHKAFNKTDKDDKGTVGLIASFLNKLDEGHINSDEFIGAVRGVIASNSLEQG
jgi:hypothetical protein